MHEENLGSRRKFVENYLLFTCITNQILALHPWSVGWRNLSKTAEKNPPAHAQQVHLEEPIRLPSPPWINPSVHLSVCLSVWKHVDF
jgi:hypothetical protein